MCKSIQSSFDNCSINSLLVYTKAKMVGKRSPFTDQIRSYIKNHCILGIQAKEIFNETKRPLYANIWNRKRLSSFRTLLIRQILPLVTFSYSRGSKYTSLEENIKSAKISVRLFFSVWTVYLQKIMKTHLKIGLKDWNFVYHMVASILKDWDKDFGIVC